MPSPVWSCHYCGNNFESWSLTAPRCPKCNDKNTRRRKSLDKGNVFGYPDSKVEPPKEETEMDSDYGSYD